MKNLVIILLVGIIGISPLSAQKNFYDFTLYGSMSPVQTPVQPGLFINRDNPLEELYFNLNEVEKFYTLGFRKNFRFSYPFYGTMGLEYSRQAQNYSLSYTHGEHRTAGEFSLSTKSQVLSIPVGVGVKFNRFDITSGLKLHYAFKSSMKEDQPMGIEMAKSQMEMGWYTGVGFSLDRTRIGIQYQGNLTRYGENLKHNGKSMGLMSVPGNVNFTIGYSF